MIKILAFSTLFAALASCTGATPQFDSTASNISSSVGSMCTAAAAAATPCVTDADCSGTPLPHCTRSWNHDLEWAVGSGFGHCVDPTGVVSSGSAIQADLCALPDPVIRGRGVPYKLPPGGALLLSDLDADGVGLLIARRVILDGSGAVLYFDPDEIDVAVKLRVHPDTNDDPNTHAAESTLRDLSIVPTDRTSSNDAVGILVQAARVGLENIRVQHFGDCIRAEGIAPEQTNSNFQFWSRLYVGNCWSNGIIMTGSDVQEGLIEQVHFSGGAGAIEDAEAGNVWVAPSTELASPHSLVLQGGSGSTVVGMALETGDPAPVGTLSSTWLGGGAIRLLDGVESRVGPARSRLTFRTSLGNVDAASVNIPGQGRWSAFQFRHDEDCDAGTCSEWRLRYDTSGSHWFLDDTSTVGEPRPLDWISPP